MTVGYLLLALAVAAASAVRWGRRPKTEGRQSASSQPLGQGPSDLPPPMDTMVTADPELVRDLDAAFERVLSDHGHELGDLLQTRLQTLVARQVPIRAIRAAPGAHRARVHFADGTVVLVRGEGRGEFSMLVRGMHSGAVSLAGFTRETCETRLELRTRGGRQVGLLAMGLDQPE